MGRAASEVQCTYKVIQYMLVMQYPAENNILKFRASEEAVKKMGDVAIHHRYCFVCHHKWVHIPAPIAIKEYVSWEYFLQFAACRGFADTHRTAYDYKVFHKVDYLIDNYRTANDWGIMAIMTGGQTSGAQLAGAGPRVIARRSVTFGDQAILDLHRAAAERRA